MNVHFDPFGFWLFWAGVLREQIKASPFEQFGEALLHGALSGLTDKPAPQSGTVPQPEKKD